MGKYGNSNKFSNVIVNIFIDLLIYIFVLVLIFLDEISGIAKLAVNVNRTLMFVLSINRDITYLATLKLEVKESLCTYMQRLYSFLKY